MITDARRLPPNSIINCDICIIGAGAAGIALASELLHSGKDVVLLEGGGTRLERGMQDLYKGEVVDPDRHGRLELYRQRRFGGTTAVWGGRCAPFDEIDFECRPYLPHSGWPIHKTDLDPYYVRAHEYCDLGTYAYRVSEALPNQPEEMIPGLESSDVHTDRLWRFSLPTNFAKEYGDGLRRSQTVRVYLHANCRRICTVQKGNAVDHLEIASSAEGSFKLRARQYVLAAGGLEVTRLLLSSDDVHTKGIGNDRDLVGRFYLSHMTGDLGEVLFRPKGRGVVWNYERTIDDVYCRRAISICEKRQRYDRLLNFRATLNHPPAADPRHENGVLSLMYLVKRFFANRIPPEYSRTLSGLTPLRHVFAHCGNVVNDLGNLTRFSGMWVRKRISSRRKLPSVAFESKSNVYTLHFDAEQSPNPDSRVTLADTTDVFGMKRLKVDWRFSDIDLESVVQSCRLISSALERSGAGTMLFRPEDIAEQIRTTCGVGSHHIGTTRMAGDPSRGVVDDNCRVYGIDNLYIASSSVFPTSGVANPTLTIVALAIRLADHLKGRAHTENHRARTIKSRATVSDSESTAQLTNFGRHRV
jgi:choline dehydrogenase-like flavoprotein